MSPVVTHYHLQNCHKESKKNASFCQMTVNPQEIQLYGTRRPAYGLYRPVLDR